MTLADILPTKLADSSIPSGGPQFHQLSDENWELKLLNDRTETLGSSIVELDLVRKSQAPDELTVKGWAAGVAERVTGLLEPLKVLEVDATRDEAILRSDGPTVRGDDRYYYEVKLQGTEQASVRRYKGNRAQGGPREQQAFALTHEVLAKLVQDITDHA